MCLWYLMVSGDVMRYEVIGKIMNSEGTGVSNEYSHALYN